MPCTKREFTIGLLGVFLMAFVSLLVRGLWRPARSSPAQRWPFRTQPHSPSEQALMEAAKARMSAEAVVITERETLIESLGPTFSEHIDHDQWRRELMARDQRGSLHRALGWASRAAALARSSQEEYRAVRLLARLECDAGHHREELKQARQLIALAPSRVDAASALAHALQCNGLSPNSTDPGERTSRVASAERNGSAHHRE